MFDRFLRIWRVDNALAKRLSQSTRERHLLLEENRRLIAVVDKYERGKFEKTEDGTIDWKMEVERLNRHNSDLRARLAYAMKSLADIETKLLTGKNAIDVARFAQKSIAYVNGEK
jgi:hypothetical protein